MRSAMRAARKLPGRSPLMWMTPLHLPVNQTADDMMMIVGFASGGFSFWKQPNMTEILLTRPFNSATLYFLY